MRTPFILSAASLLMSLAACALESQPPGARDMSDAPRASEGEPQPPNSLPSGDLVNAPIAPRAGDVATTPVGPRPRARY